jgi:Flp pilus assembly pilin Flp
MQVASYLMTRPQEVLTEESAQDAIEYLLVVGGISVAIVLAVTVIGNPTFIGSIINEVKNAVLNII